MSKTRFKAPPGAVKKSPAPARKPRQSTEAQAAALDARAFSLSEAGELEDALELLRQAIKLDPKNPRLWNNLGAALARTGDHDEAGSACAESLALLHAQTTPFDKDDAVLLSAAATGALTLLPDLAEAMLERAAKLDPQGALTTQSWGTFLLHAGREQESIEWLKRAVRLAPDDAEIHCNLGAAYAAIDDVASSTRHYRRALALDHDQPEARFNLAITCLDTGETEEAIELFRLALADDPEDAILHGFLGLSLATNGQSDEARNHRDLAAASAASIDRLVAETDQQLKSRPTARKKKPAARKKGN